MRYFTFEFPVNDDSSSRNQDLESFDMAMLHERAKDKRANKLARDAAKRDIERMWR